MDVTIVPPIAGLAGAGIAAGLWLLARGLGGYRTATRIADTGTSTVASMAAGEVRVAGIIEPAEGGKGSMSDPTPERQIWLVRHGETEWARLGRHTGRTDIPLTPAGRDQALALGTHLAGRTFQLVLTSPLSRAAETAALAGFPNAAQDPDLMEWDYGALEGRTSADIRDEYEGWTIWTGPWPAAETVDAVGARADRVIARCLDPRVTGDCLLFAHGHLLRILAARWLRQPAIGGSMFALGTATVGILGWDRLNPVIETWNEACHLD